RASIVTPFGLHEQLAFDHEVILTVRMLVGPRLGGQLPLKKRRLRPAAPSGWQDDPAFRLVVSRELGSREFCWWIRWINHSRLGHFRKSSMLGLYTNPCVGVNTVANRALRHSMMSRAVAIALVCSLVVARALAQGTVPDWCSALPRPEYKLLERVPV